MLPRNSAIVLITALLCTGYLCQPVCPQDTGCEQATVLPPVLPPEQFFGQAAMGYASAKACPHICHQVFCYCGCDITDGHQSLLDCFTGMHGADCHICQEEAMQALSLFKDGEGIAAIQKAIDEAFSSKYPFSQKSPALKHYEAIRQWNGAETQSAASTGPAPEGCCPPR